MRWNVWNLTRENWMSLSSYRTKAMAQQALDQVFSEMADGELEVRQVGDVMEQHGTKLMQLKPSAIWSAAMQDLKRRASNLENPPPYQQYAFHRRHVLKANTANDIIRAAIEQPGLGQASGKKDTRMIYSDVELLRKALA